jgi:hydroxymethylglutaryl-CoA reductase (NADPH)
MGIPRQLIRQLYTFGSLRNVDTGVRFQLKNRLVDVQLVTLHRVALNGRDVPLERVQVDLGEGLQPSSALDGHAFALREPIDLHADRIHLDDGHHAILVDFEVEGFGRFELTVEDVLAHSDPDADRNRIPHSDRDDYSADLVAARQRFVKDVTGVELDHVSRFSFDPATTQGNIENFTGVAQVPLGFAGPILVRGEHADGEFVVPMATTEGTLIASYNRGIKVLNLAGGTLVTVSGDSMQRAPVFEFESAREARDFKAWCEERVEAIRTAAEATSSVAKLRYVEAYLVNRQTYLRFNYTTGDAAGQNMVGRATFAACQWILANNDTIRGFYLEANLATDKKHSHINVMKTRGKRVTAECTIPRELLVEHMRVRPEQLDHHARLGTMGTLLSGASNNGCHSPNGIAAMFIATGQDVANVAESSAALLYSEVTPEGDLYLSVTIPSLIVATHGGGTKLATQQECLRVMGCTGRGSVHKLAEIMGAVVLAGELSLGAAISSLDWVSSHERLGRNR